MRTVTLEEGEWQVLVQLVVNAMINANPVLQKVIAQLQQPPRGNSHDAERAEERGSAGRGGEAAAVSAE